MFRKLGNYGTRKPRPGARHVKRGIEDPWAKNWKNLEEILPPSHLRPEFGTLELTFESEVKRTLGREISLVVEKVLKSGRNRKSCGLEKAHRLEVDGSPPYGLGNRAGQLNASTLAAKWLPQRTAFPKSRGKTRNSSPPL